MNQAASRDDLRRRSSGGSFQNKLANKRRKAGDVEISIKPCFHMIVTIAAIAEKSSQRSYGNLSAIEIVTIAEHFFQRS